MKNCNRFQHWPPVQRYNQIFSNSPFRFTELNSVNVRTAGGYEQYIREHKSIPTRENNWHDFYNALVWHLFPRSKLALHHHQISAQEPDLPRSPLQNGMTLFDECGMVILTTSHWLEDLLVEHKWLDLFIQRREQLRLCSQLITFGHSLYERYHSPYLGLTGKCLVAQIEPGVLELPWEQKYQWLDQWIENEIPFSPKALHPIPLLGWPGWWPDNHNEDFYQNRNYFRPKRKK